ncbi:putative ribonuclease H protein At1g65750 [Lycium ferocissimum]|uniref:putative ribonuclease H protein At1g65750 n=1 Tax=Lycium ferocissimum TaxID=112874 RepID=UPI002816312B|nr:putative ribonuclease H protein At1g65750 [Lycium ferocissimum]
MSNGAWNVQKLMQLFPEDIVQHIVQEIDIKHGSNEWDTPWWMMTSSGKFTVGSTWELLRQRAKETVPFHNMWIKVVPFKIFFFLWRLWKFKVPIDQFCYLPESINYLFLCGDFAAKVWRYFNAAAGLTMNCVQVKYAIRSWCEAKCHYKLRPVFKVVPAFIVSQIWKWRNNQLHEGTMTFNRVIYDINMNIHLLCKVLFPGLNVPKRWHHTVQFFEDYQPTIVYKVIRWMRPAAGWYKCNTDGAAKGNPGLSSAAFCIRNEEGDVVYAAVKKLQDGSNLVAEVEAIRMGLKYCLNKQLFPLIMETDSMAMKMILAAE